MILCLIPFRIRFVLIVIVPLDWRFLYSEVLILRQKYKIQIRISEIQEITAFRDSKSGSFLSKRPGITEYKVIFVFLIKTRYMIKFAYVLNQNVEIALSGCALERAEELQWGNICSWIYVRSG